MAESEIKVLIKGVDEASSVLRQVASEVSNVASQAVEASSAVDRFGNMLSSLKDIAKIAAGVLAAELARDALGALTEAFGKAGKQFAELEWTLTAVVKASGETGDAARQLYARLDEVSHAQTELGYTSVEAAKALESLVKAGIKGEAAAKALTAALQMARIEGISTAEASNLLIGVMNQFGYSAEDAAKVVDILVNASVAGVDAASDFGLALSYVGAQAASMGLSLEETTAALVAINNQGIAAEKAGRYLASMLTDLVEKSDKLGFSIYDSSGKMLSLSEIVGKLVDKLKSFGSQAERDAYLNEIFSSQSIRAALALMNLGGESTNAQEALAELERQMGRTGSAAETTNALMETARGRMMALEAQIANANESLGAMSLQLQLAWKQFALGLGPIGAVADALGPSLLQGAITGVMVALPQLIASLGGLTGILGGVKSAFAALNAVLLANPIMLVVTAVGALIAILVTAYQTCEPFRNAVNAVGEALYNFLKPAVDATIGALQWLWNNVLVPLGDFLKSVFAVYITYLATVVQALQAAWNALTGAFQWAWDNIIKPLTDFFGAVLAVNLGIVKGAVEGLKAAWDALAGGLKWVWENILKPIADFLWNNLKPAFDAVKGAVDAFKGVWDALSGVGSAVSNAIGSVADALKSLCFRHATPMAIRFNEVLKESVGLTYSMNTQLKGLSRSLKDAERDFSGAKREIEDFQAGVERVSVKPRVIEKIVEMGYTPSFEAAAKLLGGPVKLTEDLIKKWEEAGYKYVYTIEQLQKAGIPTPPGAEAVSPFVAAGGLIAGLEPFWTNPNVTVEINAPLVHVEGSADRRTAELAVDMIQERLKTVIIEATSSGAPVTKRIRLLRV